MNQIWKIKSRRIIMSYAATIVAPLILLLLFFVASRFIDGNVMWIVSLLVGGLLFVGSNIWYWVSLFAFADEQKTDLDKIYVGNIADTVFNNFFVAIAVTVISVCLGINPVIVVFLMSVPIGVNYIVMLKGYKYFAKHPELNENCHRGFKILSINAWFSIFLAFLPLILLTLGFIIGLVCGLFGVSLTLQSLLIISWVEIAIYFVAGILALTSTVLNFVGWAKIMNNGPEE